MTQYRAIGSHLTMQSNITAQVEQGMITYNEAEAWLYHQLNPFFSTEKRTIRFGGWMKYLKKSKYVKSFAASKDRYGLDKTSNRIDRAKSKTHSS